MNKVSYYIQKYLNYEVGNIERHQFENYQIYIIDDIKFQISYDDSSYCKIDDEIIYYDWSQIRKLRNIFNLLWSRSGGLYTKFLLESDLKSIVDMRYRDKLLRERFIEFEIIKEGKVDQISWDSLIEYYAR